MITVGKNIKISKRLFAFVGNYGSGKTEVSVNFTLAIARAVKDKVHILDCDVVNPYFRCREAREVLENAGIDVVYPKGEYAWADLPIVLPQIKGVIKEGNGYAVLDVGGDDVGARIMASFEDVLSPETLETLFVLNVSRPFTEEEGGAVQILKDIERSSKLTISGLAINAHLISETTPEVVERGIALGEQVSKTTGLPIVFVAVMEDVLAKMDVSKIKYPVLSMQRLLLPPWELSYKTAAPKLGPKNFKLS